MTQKAIVTGGVRGIGRAIVEGLASRGIQVVATSHRPIENLRLPPSAYVETLDLASPASIGEFVGRHSDATILVNNAGEMNGFSLSSYDDATRARIMNINLVSPVHLMWELGNQMVIRGGGRIVNNTSIAAHIGHPDVWYGATKAGLLNATKSLARALGPKGVVVNAVAAGPTNTEMLNVIPDDRKAVMRSASILGRFAEPEEVAAAVVWLATESPSYVNGICIDINNGSFMR